MVKCEKNSDPRREIPECNNQMPNTVFDASNICSVSVSTTHHSVDLSQMHVSLKLYIIFLVVFVVACAESFIGSPAPVKLLLWLLSVCARMCVYECVCACVHLHFMNFRSNLNCCIARAVHTTLNKISIEAAYDQLISLIREVRLLQSTYTRSVHIQTLCDATRYLSQTHTRRPARMIRARERERRKTGNNRQK